MFHSSVARQAALVGALVLAGLNLRPALAAIGPLLAAIRADLPMSYVQVSGLTMLPVLAMGLAMFRGGRLSARWGEHRVVGLALALIGLASLARLFASSVWGLMASALAAGAGIALVQAVLPGLIKRRFPQRLAGLMGIYVTAIMAGAALSAALSPWMAARFGHWQGGLAVWSALALLALAGWHGVGGQVTGEADAPRRAPPAASFAGQPRAWLLGVFFGLGTAAYTCVLAWLPPYFVEQGWQATESGLLLALLTGMEVLSGLLMPALAARSLDRRPTLFLLLTLVIIGFFGLALAPLSQPLLWACLLGLGIGGLFPLSLIVAMDHLDSPRRAGELTAFVQGVGYLIAALSPLAAGWIKDLTASFAQAWQLLALMSAAMLAMAWRFRPRDYARHFPGG
ncbi:MFS transporter [Xenophilus sp. AP218F]|nr:MFS transporter [Xenophilus sp. AP218F]